MPISETDIVLADPAALAARLIHHLVEHEVAFETRGGGTVADLGRGNGRLMVPARIGHRAAARMRKAEQPHRAVVPLNHGHGRGNGLSRRLLGKRHGG
ncbi:hypothetical protein [Methylobacterium haplocladii]|uniref:Uncharacterized protein n=1 Tax=Methylobacterium haplocladii TaxID=1176176 RepID=A0A512ISS3_9HYPH|nr:hypothetical protein [Methylobacterium haplocladii]GEP00762.1 hypothetical protein MHA02_31490 [Methylobacterium haplocladii]GJD83097.1 hypothetical protein HPGCJGGD_0959 [Methylobacterium haplocladii]GLS60679.1 hypothetical protein GCM10007887_33630 [Methylobacterium haplocladii]